VLAVISQRTVSPGAMVSAGTAATLARMSVDTQLVLTVTDEAIEKVLEIRDGEDDPETLCLRVEVTGVSGPEYTYDLAFEPVDSKQDGDHLSEQGGLAVVVPADSVEQLRGATRNPNRPDPLAGVELELTGDLAEKVQQLLAGSINPSLAAHGGFASLVGVEDTKVFLSMGGGCQGCAMSAATLREGIQVAIKEAIPEVTEVIDVTDHEAGDSPYYS